jgi:hypothetical protein
MNPKTRMTCGVVGLFIAGVLPIPSRGAEQEAVFDLNEVSPFPEMDRDPSIRLAYGVSFACSDTRPKQLTRFRELKSRKPLFGIARFCGGSQGDPKGVELGFVLDESGGTGTGYDRLLVDTNADGDLNKESVLEPMQHPPQSVVRYLRSRNKGVFDYVTITLDCGPDLGRRPVHMLPVFVEQKPGQGYLQFISAVARKGNIRIGTRQYQIVLGQILIPPRYDHARVCAYLSPMAANVSDPKQAERWWGAEAIGAFRYVDGTYYRLAASPGGDKLFVRPYRGDLGVFEIAPGDRKLTDVTMSGSLRSEASAVAVGELKGQWPEKARRVEIPVGNYLPAMLNVQYGTLYISLSNNYHSDGRGRRATAYPWVYSVKIRKDKPFVLDFSNKPQVIFPSPASDQRFKPGDEVKVKGVLIDPVLDIMIRGLTDTARKEKKIYRSTDSKGQTQEQTYDRNVSLDPTVTIANSKGEKVTEGVMPFG